MPSLQNILATLTSPQALLIQSAAPWVIKLGTHGWFWLHSRYTGVPHSSPTYLTDNAEANLQKLAAATKAHFPVIATTEQAKPAFFDRFCRYLGLVDASPRLHQIHRLALSALSLATVTSIVGYGYFQCMGHYPGNVCTQNLYMSLTEAQLAAGLVTTAYLVNWLATSIMGPANRFNINLRAKYLAKQYHDMAFFAKVSLQKDTENPQPDAIRDHKKLFSQVMEKLPNIEDSLGSYLLFSKAQVEKCTKPLEFHCQQYLHLVSSVNP